jgi:cytidylate kinase
MPVITINGPVGCGAVEVGQLVARNLNLNYVDRLVFAQAARLVRSPVGALIDKEQWVDRFRDRLARFLGNVLEHYALYPDDSEPYFRPGIEMLPSQTYQELAREPTSVSQKLSDKAFIEAITTVVRDLHQSGDVVIIGRGANVILADAPGVIHVGMLAPLVARVETIMQRERFPREEAQAYVEKAEQARVEFFRKFFKVNPNNPSHYHLVLNLREMPSTTAAETIIRAAGDLVS